MKPPNLDAMSHGLAVEFLRSLRSRNGVDPEIDEALRLAEDRLCREETDSPFLTVLLRTQGLRLEPLRDALLCLEAQSDDDFTVVLLVHSNDDSAIAAVEHIVTRLEPSFGARVHVAVVREGLRGAPLNVGLEQSTSRYVAIFDDDDLLLGDWVEAFRQAASEHPGRALRAQTANMAVQPATWPQGQAGVVGMSWPRAEYPREFDLHDHLVVNQSPFMSWAFPRMLFSKMGVRFDESLEVCEDWDMVLTAASICGVADIDRLTSIYRRWETGSSSYTAHSRDAWNASELRVRQRFDAQPLVFPAGSVERSRRLVSLADLAFRYRLLFSANHLRQPLEMMWRSASPVIHLAARVYRRLKR